MKYNRIPLPVLTVLSTIVLLLQTAAQTAPAVPPNAPAAPTPDEPKEQPAEPAEGPAAPAPAEQPKPAPQRVVTPKPQKKPEKLYSFKFEGSDLDVVMQTYCDWTEQIYLKNDAVKATITLKASNLTKKECIEVVEAILAMNNIALVPMGEKFIKVVQATAADLTGQGLMVNMDPDQEFGSTDKFVTQIIQLKHVEIPEVQTAVQHLMHAYGKIQTLAGNNSLMITDTEANVKRVRELIEFLDQATASIEPRIYQIEYADASEIASKLNEIITLAQADQKKTSTATPPAGATSVRTPPGVIRARSVRGQPGQAAAPTRATISQTEGGSTVIIQGTVKVMADERTNLIIIFSIEENFAFFDKIIEVLDVEVEPATTFEVINLEYADAAELSGTLNDLIGAASSSRSSSSRSSTGSSSSRTGSSSSRTGSSSSRTGSSSSRTGSSSQRVTPNAAPAAGTATIENLNRLSEDTKILADERSNSILLMGSKSDIAAIKEVIKSLDVMLEQVVIEAAIFEIGLDNDLRHGIDWIYQSQDGNKIGAWDGASLLTNSLGAVVSGALSYYQNLTGIDSQILINISKTDQDARLISTPVIMTTDNTEATLSIGEQRPVVTSTDSFANSSGTQRSNYEYKDIGIQLTVTPRINPQRFVVMELVQRADQLGGNVDIDGNLVPIIKNREFEASIAVPHGGTVVLGGLISTEVSDTVNKIPILGDIPLLGRYIFSSISKIEQERELIVLMTPYVMTDHESMLQQTERLYRGTDLEQGDWGDNNWSESKLRLIPDPETMEEDVQ
jgi:general secretion pathway protein D